MDMSLQQQSVEKDDINDNSISSSILHEANTLYKKTLFWKSYWHCWHLGGERLNPNRNARKRHSRAGDTAGAS
jgi:hypothetical protein